MLPGGGTFTINGTLTTYDKRTSFELEAEVPSEASGSGSIVGFAIGGGRQSPRPFAPKLDTGCRPAEFAIVYGLLGEPRDVVLARTASGLVPLSKAKIPHGLNAHGVLAYAALPSVPEEVIVRNSKGKTVSATKLATEARDAREACEGEAEG
jgi:hypothetical protein